MIGYKEIFSKIQKILFLPQNGSERHQRLNILESFSHVVAYQAVVDKELSLLQQKEPINSVAKTASFLTRSLYLSSFFHSFQRKL